MQMTQINVLSDELREDLVSVYKRIPPLWDLPNYVAVNPYLGFTQEPFAEASAVIHDGLGAQVLPSVDYYRARWQEGAFSRAELADAAERYGEDGAFLKKVLDCDALPKMRAAQGVLTFAEQHDAHYGTSWERFLVVGAARWCAAQQGEGRAFALAPEQKNDLYGSWREAAQADRSLEIAGLRGWRDWAKELPEQADEAIKTMLSRLEVTPAERPAYLYRLLKGVYGWASFFRRASWETADATPGLLPHLIAIRLCGDAAVVLAQQRVSSISVPHIKSPHLVEEELHRLIFQEALEDKFARTLLAKVAPQPVPCRAHPAVQAVFCIDTRSERMRRNLEAVTPNVHTMGFAGFFGVSLAWQNGGSEGGSARCPVLLKPTAAVKPTSVNPTVFATPSAGKALKYAQNAPSASFTFVELLGAVYGLGLAEDALNAGASQKNGEDTAAFGFEMTAPDKLDLATGILKNLGLRTTFGRLILFCGHQGCSANNSHSASLDCGACGGHGGAINARVAAMLLNDPVVRQGLHERGCLLPDDTYFLPGLHDTSTDDVTLLDTDQVPPTHQADLADLKQWLAEASARARKERAPALGLNPQEPRLWEKLRRRSHDWSEVRPEWGLARNAAFVAVRRQRTSGIDLEGRAFLHDYDWNTDPDNSILALILSAPMIVASWINLQYFASTVDNEMFGCGTKALHNRVEMLGVVLGNSGDLRTGLPLQSVHSRDGRWYHEPLRLQVIVEAPISRIEAALTVCAPVLDLVKNGWVRLYVLDPESASAVRWTADGWKRVACS